MPDEKDVVEWQVAPAHRGRNQVCKQSEASLGLEEFCVVGKQLGMNDFFHAGKVDLSVFRVGVITLYCDCCQSQ